MEIGSKITCVDQEEFTIIKSMNEAGGQGTLWLVEDHNKNQYAFKKLKKDKKFIQKKGNIDKIINENIHQIVENKGKKDNIKFMLPLKRTKMLQDDTIGYIMHLANGKSINSILTIPDVITNIPLETKLKILRQVVLSVDILHSIGYCYADISWGNFMYDFSKETLYVVDCDNIASQSDIRNNKANFVSGTGFFVAPEVAFDGKTIDLNTEHYSLAVFIFRFLLNNLISSPYHGYILHREMEGVMPQSTFDIADMINEFGLPSDWCVFVFDENNPVNSIRRLIDDYYLKQANKGQSIKDRIKELEQCISLWNIIPIEIKNLLIETFSNLRNPRRPSTIQWNIAIQQALSKDNININIKQNNDTILSKINNEVVDIKDNIEIKTKPVRKPFVGQGEIFPTNPQPKKKYKKFEGGKND